MIFERWFPGRCLACDLPTPAGQPDLCRQCFSDLPWCSTVAAPDPAARQVLAAVYFQGTVRHWVHRLKYHGGLAEGRVLGQILTTSITAQYLPRSRLLGTPAPWLQPPAALVPVPMPASSWLRRGRNQATLLAQPLARALSIPIAHQLVSRTHKRVDQHTLGAAERAQLRSDVFRVLARPPRRLAIVDDVLTTGATTAALTRALLQAGAQEVHVWCLAYTDHHSER